MNEKEKRWLGTQKYEIHCFYCGGFHITGNCPQREQKIIVAYKGSISAIKDLYVPVGRL